jgi:hypothetical protein
MVGIRVQTHIDSGFFLFSVAKFLRKIMDLECAKYPAPVVFNENILVKFYKI